MLRGVEPGDPRADSAGTGMKKPRYLLTHGGRRSAGQGKLGRVAGNQVQRLEREGLRQGKQVRKGIQGSSRVGIPGQSSRMTRRGTGDRDQSQSGQNCSGEENSKRLVQYSQMSKDKCIMGDE